MRMSNVLNECFTRYKIEKWNEKENHWDFVAHFITLDNARYHYRDIVLNNPGIFRLVRVYELTSNIK